MKPSILILSLCLGGHSAVLADKDHHHDHGSDEKRTHQAHVHGSGKLTLVAMDNQLMIEMLVPGFDIVGFEHQPTTDEQQQSVKAAIKQLQNSDANVSFPDDAKCQSSGSGIVETALEYEHDEHQDINHHDHQDEGSNHAEFHITYNFNCEDISELEYVEILSFGQFANMKKLTAQAATESGQFSATITPKATRFNLQ